MTAALAYARATRHVEHPISASIMGAVLDKVVGPDVIAVCSGRSRIHDPSASQSLLR